jgi:hypothetical protein
VNKKQASKRKDRVPRYAYRDGGLRAAEEKDEHGSSNHKQEENAANLYPHPILRPERMTRAQVPQSPNAFEGVRESPSLISSQNAFALLRAFEPAGLKTSTVSTCVVVRWCHHYPMPITLGIF